VAVLIPGGEEEIMKNATRWALQAGLTIMCTGCLTDPELKLDYEGYEPEALSDGWQVSGAADEGLDPEMLEGIYRDFFREDGFPTARGLLVVRHGKLVAEAYARDRADRERYHNVQSVAKSVTSLAAGIALDDGLLPSVDVPLFDLMPQHFDDDPRKRSLSLRHALTMQTGLAPYSDEDTGAFMYSDGSSVEKILHQPLVSDPGTSFYYTDDSPQLVSAAVQTATGRSLEAFAAERLFAPLGITGWRWEHHGDGVTFGAIGLWLRPRDMARIGQMVLQGGTWQNRRVVSEQWLEESMQIRANGDYGYYWWVYDEGRVIGAKGAGGQMIFIVPELDLVVVMTCDSSSQSWLLSPGIGDLVSRILQAVRD
jgi:CubicO group peptidase (beta-lactamase class C family)